MKMMTLKKFLKTLHTILIFKYEIGKTIKFTDVSDYSIKLTTVYIGKMVQEFCVMSLHCTWI